MSSPVGASGSPPQGDGQSVASQSSDGSELSGTSGGAPSSSAAMRELRARIQRERQQLQDLEAQLAHRKPFQQAPPASLATQGRTPATDTVGTLRVSRPASPPKISPTPARLGESARTRNGSTKQYTPVGALSQSQENLFPSQQPSRTTTVRASFETQPTDLSSMQTKLIMLQADHGKMQGTIASLQDAVSKLESSLREEKTLASGQGKVDRDDEIVQTLKSHLLEIEREQQGQASKLLEQERILSACRFDMGDLQQQVISMKSILENLGSAQGQRHRLDGVDESGEDARTPSARIETRQEGTSKGRRSENRSTRGQQSAVPFLLILAAPFAVVFVCKHSEGLKEVASKVLESCEEWRL